MSIFLCQPNGDFDLSSNQLSLTDGPQEVLQLIRDNLRFFRGEEPLNLNLGVPYFQQILDKQTPLTTAEAILRSVVAGTDGVTQVLNFSLDLDRDTRGATVSFTVTTDGGPVTATESIP
jgi:hypothetical protein